MGNRKQQTEGGGGGGNRRMDRRILKIFFPGFLDSEQDFYGFSDPAIAADCGFIHFGGRILEFACI